MPETVWAVHNFEAEADDEISFQIGEPIVILQKDELYQDGWWEVSLQALEMNLGRHGHSTKDTGGREVEEEETDFLWRPTSVA